MQRPPMSATPRRTTSAPMRREAERAAPASFTRRLRDRLDRLLTDQEPGCRDDLVERATKAVNLPMWREIDVHWGVEACARFNRVADSLLRSGDPASDPIDRHLATVTEEIGIEPWEAQILDWIAGSAAYGPVRYRWRAVAAMVRAFGMSICAERESLARCACWKAIASDRSRGRSRDGRAPGIQQPGTGQSGTGTARRSGDVPPTPTPTDQHGADGCAQTVADFVVETIVKDVCEATASLGWETLNEAVRLDLDPGRDGSVVAALYKVAEALDALREGAQQGIYETARRRLDRSDLPPWARELGARIIVSLAGLPVNTHMHIAALGIRLFGACLEAEIAALGRPVPAHEALRDVEVRHLREELWRQLEPLCDQEALADLVVRLQPLCTPEALLDLVVRLEPLCTPEALLDLVVRLEPLDDHVAAADLGARSAAHGEREPASEHPRNAVDGMKPRAGRRAPANQVPSDGTTSPGPPALQQEVEWTQELVLRLDTEAPALPRDIEEPALSLEAEEPEPPLEAEEPEPPRQSPEELRPWHDLGQGFGIDL